MSEIGEAFSALKEAGAAKRRENQENSTRILDEKGVEFESKNRGVHLVVTGKDGLIDFWPSTGKFLCRNKSCQGRGVLNLIKLCEVKNGD